MAKPRRRTTYQKACQSIETEGRRQCFLLYGAAALALYRHWDLRQTSIRRFLEVTSAVWEECASTNLHSMIEMCENETGIEIQNGEGKSWKDLPYLNGTIDWEPQTNAQWIYMRQQQKKWIAPQIMACLLIALHRKYGFGYGRCSKIYGQIRQIEEEFGMDPDKVQAACLAETGIDVTDAFMKKQRGEEREVV